LVVACWAVSLVCVLPALWVIGDAVVGPLANLPEEGAPPSDVLLIVVERLGGLLAPLKLAVVSGFVALWSWAVLWHAGLVGWRLWSGGRRVRLGEVLGLGVVSWWRYARLSMTAASVTAISLALVWLPVSRTVTASFQEMAEGRAMALIGLGTVLSGIVFLLVWTAHLRAAWMLGQPERRSAVLAWLRGLVDTLRTPVASVGTVVVWGVPALIVSTLPLVAGSWFEGLRGAWALPVLGQAVAAFRAACWVGLFLSYAPITGLVNDH
jgi:hypothetical protein